MRPLTMLLIILFVGPIAHAQEQPARTWAGFGFSVAKSTAQDSGQAITGVGVRLAYDLRHGLQVRGEGEYRNNPTIKRLFSGRQPDEATSELRYAGGLYYHLPVERSIRPFAGAGTAVTRQFFRLVESSKLPESYDLYDSSVNPTLIVGAAIGRYNEIVFTKYLADRYSYSHLRGWGVDYTNTRKVDGRLYLRTGLRFARWSFYQGESHYGRRAVDVSGFVGFHFQ